MKKGYWVVTYRSISDPDKLKDYAAIAGPALAASGAKTLVRTSEGVQAFEAGLPQRVVVLEFESVEKARAAFDSPEYAKAKAILHGAAERDVRIVEGIE